MLRDVGTGAEGHTPRVALRLQVALRHAVVLPAEGRLVQRGFVLAGAVHARQDAQVALLLLVRLVLQLKLGKRDGLAVAGLVLFVARVQDVGDHAVAVHRKVVHLIWVAGLTAARVLTHAAPLLARLPTAEFLRLAQLRVLVSLVTLVQRVLLTEVVENCGEVLRAAGHQRLSILLDCVFLLLDGEVVDLGEVLGHDCGLVHR